MGHLEVIGNRQDTEMRTPVKILQGTRLSILILPDVDHTEAGKVSGLSGKLRHPPDALLAALMNPTIKDTMHKCAS